MSHSATSHTRLTEWLLAALMVAWGLAVAIPGETLVPAGYRVLAELAPEDAWAAISIAIGAMRMAALTINGRWRRSPLLRAGGAAWGLGWWLGLAVLVWLGAPPGTLPTTVAYYPVLALFEGLSVWRGTADAYRSGAIRQWTQQRG